LRHSQQELRDALFETDAATASADLLCLVAECNAVATRCDVNVTLPGDLA
jgi:hypothetical protein